MTQWYYADAQGQRQGPFTAEEFGGHYRHGRMARDSLVWREGMDGWQPLQAVAGELDLPVQDAVLASSIEPTDAGSMSPYTPPGAVLAADAVHATAVEGEVVQAGFWKRLAAYLIDGFLIGVATQLVQMVLMVLFLGVGGLGGGFGSNPDAMFTTGLGIAFMLSIYLIPLAMQAIYFAAFHASSKQATPGKMAVGIKVVDDAGRRISMARGIGRYFAGILSSLILCVGYLMVAFTQRKQGLHDMICSTQVVDKWAYTDHPEWQRRELGTVTVVILAIFGGLTLLALVALLFMVGMLATLKS